MENHPHRASQSSIDRSSSPTHKSQQRRRESTSIIQQPSPVSWASERLYLYLIGRNHPKGRQSSSLINFEKPQLNSPSSPRFYRDLHKVLHRLSSKWPTQSESTSYLQRTASPCMAYIDNRLLRTIWKRLPHGTH